MSSHILQVIIVNLIILDYMRAVIENGNNFTKQNLMMMLNELKPEFIDAQIAKYLRILFSEMKVNEAEFNEYINNV